MSKQFDKLLGLLKELFQLDQPDLDFGIYRIMHAKADEVTQFLNTDLLPQVKAAFAQYTSADKAELQKALAKAIEQATGLGVDPESTAKVKELRQKLASESVDVGALEAEVYDHLYSFFRRYYQDGDFLAKRVYKPSVYAIPYEGEEIKVYWANCEQYYIKTTEYLRDYAFTLQPGDKSDPMRVHFRLVDAVEGEHGNIKATEGKNPVFILAKEDPIVEENGELIIRFNYRPATLEDWTDEARKNATAAAAKKPPTQKELIAIAAKQVLASTEISFARWISELAKPHIKTNNEQAGYTRLEGHLGRYVGRNAFDYFIHKDLGGFLRRELDFYIKNEVMYLDDIESETAPRVDQYLSKIKVIRKIAHKLIDFLAQLEDFQRKIWLKKKFVVETNYCITLDRIPEEFYGEIATNHLQRDEWVKLFAIEDIEATKSDPGYSTPLTTDFLKSNLHLVLDTALFDETFKDRLLDKVENLDKTVGGILMHSDNFQALSLIQRRLAEQVKCSYIDPPYNTDASAILYKNNYRHSSWGTMMRDRLAVARHILKPDGAIFVSIDKVERTLLEHVLDDVFGEDNHIEELIWTQNTANSQLPNYSTNHEYVEVYSKNRQAVEGDAQMFREPKPGFADVMEVVEELRPSYPSVASIEAAIKTLFKSHIASLKEEAEAAGKEWDEEAKRQDSWRGLFPYSKAEYRDANGALVEEGEAKKKSASIWIWREISPAAPASKQAPSTRDPNHFNYRYYKPPHPVTGKPCPCPRTGWKFPYEPDPDNAGRRSFVELDRDHRIVWGEDETKVPQIKGFLHDVESNIGTSVFYEYNDGEAELTEMFGQSGLFLSPKSSRFVKKFVAQTTRVSDCFIDFFGGSGSSGHGVISLNREDDGRRKYILIEIGNHFDTILLPRIKKAIYSQGWRSGKPTDRVGTSQIIKYCRLESYEDALNNLLLRRSAPQKSLLDSAQAEGDLREQYTLRYMLDVEERGSQSLLNIEAFADPTAYTLKVKRPGTDETLDVAVDLLETFNYLIGLTVQSIAAPMTFSAAFERDGEKRLQFKERLKQTDEGPWWFRTVMGTTPDGSKTLIIWRKLTGDAEQDNLVLDEWFGRQDYSTKDYEFDLIYVNGDNNLENLRQPDEM